MSAFDHMRRQLEHGNFDDLTFSVHRVTRALTAGA
jgi:arginine decarboxylase